MDSPKTFVGSLSHESTRSGARVKEFAERTAVSKLAQHDLRRSGARLCRAAGGELEQIQFLLGHISVQTTERCLGCTQRIASVVNDKIGIEPAA